DRERWRQPGPGGSGEPRRWGRLPGRPGGLEGKRRNARHLLAQRRVYPGSICPSGGKLYRATGVEDESPRLGHDFRGRGRRGSILADQPDRAAVLRLDLSPRASPAGQLQMSCAVIRLGEKLGLRPALAWIVPSVM